jgi:hypothetical protein
MVPRERGEEQTLHGARDHIRLEEPPRDEGDGMLEWRDG